MTVNQQALAQMLAAGNAPGGWQTVNAPQMQTAQGLPIGYGAGRVPVQNTPPQNAAPGPLPPGPMGGGGRGKNIRLPQPSQPIGSGVDDGGSTFQPPVLPPENRPPTQWEIEQEQAAQNPDQKNSGSPWDIGPSLADYKRLFPYQAYGRAATWNDPEAFSKALERTGVDSYRLNWLGRNGEPIRGSGQTLVYRNGGWQEPARQAEELHAMWNNG